MSNLDFGAIAQVTTAAKQQANEVQDLKVKLYAAELTAVYNDVPSATLMRIAFESVCKDIAIKEGAKWDNQKQNWDKKGQAIISNLETISKNGGSYYYNYDNKQFVCLDTEARLNSFAKALRKEYIRRYKEVVRTKQRKDIDERIKALYAALSGTLKGEMLVEAVAAALHCSRGQVKAAIK